MKVLQEAIRKLMVTDVQGLDPVSIYLEDNGAGQGKITVTCFNESWTARWGGMGNRTVAEFVRSCDNQYLAKNLSKIPSEIDDVGRIPKDLIKIILEKRKRTDLTAEQARDYYDRADGLRHFDPSELLNQHDLFYDLYGEEWWHCIPKKSNPDYEYLCRIITTVKEALKEVT
jgi:hypothetical protein